MQLPSGAGWQQKGAKDKTALIMSSSAVDMDVCCKSGTNTEPLLLSSARQPSYTEIQEEGEAKRAPSSPNVRLVEGRRLQMCQLSDHDWGVIDWTGGKSILIGDARSHASESKL